jgi:conjugative relaxase-like TrwC/TraI family protein
MMGLAKMAPNGWAYYAKEIAAGVEDYYFGHGEDPGRWMGRGADALGLSGEVDVEGLSRLFGQCCHPVTGTALGRPYDADSTAVAGYALSFSPPKSVSVLWALADEDVSAVVRAGHDAAVDAAMEFLGEHAAFCRRGHGGASQEPTRGLLAAVFVHRTSRAGDPQLHSHVLVANKVQAVSDGRWLTLDGRELYEVQKAAGMLYKACVRAELTARLGVAGWTATAAPRSSASPTG